MPLVLPSLLGSSFAHIPHLLLLSLLLPGVLLISVWLPICMSVPALLIEAIRAAIIGLRATADALESALARSLVSVPPLPDSGLPQLDLESARSSVGSWEFAGPTPFPDSEARPTQVPSDLGSSSSGYNAVASSIPPVPCAFLGLCHSLGSPAECRSRALRAWTAGCWAKAVLEGKIPKPRPTPKIPQRPSVYIVLRAPGVDRPARVSTSNEYFRLIPTFTESTLSHSFPSIAEARVYCEGAGVPFPDYHYSQ